MSSERIEHFWINSAPFCEATLFVVPTPAAPVELPKRSKVQIFDADGELVNEITIDCDNGGAVALELDPFLEGCKFESGLRHAHLVVTSPAHVRATCRMHNRAGAIISGASVVVSPEHAAFAPVTLSPSRSTLVSLINLGDVDTSVRVRLILGSRNPDVMVRVPARGARVIPIEGEFRSILIDPFQSGERTDQDLSQDFEETRAYVRVSVRERPLVAMQLIESEMRNDVGTTFTAIAR